MSSNSRRVVAVDRGGTFTDVVLREPDGSLRVAKVLSGDDAVRRAIEALGEPSGDLRVGSTVATNALLTRRGARAALIVTAGFRDVLRIGHQARPELFELGIRRPEPWVTLVEEVDERIRADGAVERAPDEGRVRDLARRLLARGVESVGVALVHAARFPDHEDRIGTWMRDEGFVAVALSHVVCPEVGFHGRAATVAAEAFVGPIVERWIAGLPEPVELLRSSGGLASVDAFVGVDAVLSGPAGGAVAAGAVARSLGLPKVLGFDMGGTSTDVCRWAGEDVLRDHVRLAGQELRVAAVDIHTVAAGGGSILTVQDGRVRVGPASAGSEPGPACYGRGGPATVTDLNVVLGRVRPESFPRVFGPDGDQPLDVTAARRAVDALGVDPAGFLAVADEAMASAIATLSTARGHDPKEHALLAFGGAAGQHACGVAERLGIRRVVAHPQSSVLSAFGLAHAPRTARRARPVEELWTDDLPNRLRGRIDALAAEARAEVADPDAIVTVRWELRYAGALQTLIAEDASDFATIHRRRFGFVRPGRSVQAARLVVTARTTPPRLPSSTSAPRRRSLVPPGLLTVPTPLVHPDAAGRPRVFDAPTVRWADLRPGQGMAGPLRVEGERTTLVIDDGWSLVAGAHGVLHAERDEQHEAMAEDTRRDPVRLELYHRRFMGIAERMGENLRRTAWSPNIKDRLDFSCAVFDAAGRLVANAPHIPVHLGAMGETVRHLIHYMRVTRRIEGEGFSVGPSGLRIGDCFVVNDPFKGGSHLPDITVVSPVVVGGSVGAWVACRAHHADVGGITPGSMPPFSTRLSEEGVLLDVQPLATDGVVHREALARALSRGPHPARDVDACLADLEAQVAACALGAELLGDRLRASTATRAYLGHIQTNGAEVVREWLETQPSGPRRFDDALDDGTPIAVTLTVTGPAAGRRLVVDFDGTGPALQSNLNAPPAVARAAVLYVLRCLIGRDVPLNEGCLDVVDLNIPVGSLLDPPAGSAVVGGNVETSQRVVDVLLGAFGAAAASQGTMNNLTFGTPEGGWYETICGGEGATPGHRGADAVHTHMTNTRITDAEVLEARAPVVVRRFAIRSGSGGGGLQRGGDGVVRALEFTSAATVSLLSQRRLRPPFGLEGGAAGAVGEATLIRAGVVEKLPGAFTIRVKAGDVVEVRTPGGGGFGEGVEVL